MPQDLQAIVQRMIDANEPEENIATVIQHVKAQSQRVEGGPETYAGGFLKGLGEGVTGGAKGFAKGIAKSPFALMRGMAQTAAHPIQAVKGLASIPSAVGQAFSHAGADPEGWGEGVGNLTGQTMLTAGIPKGVSAASVLPGQRLAQVGWAGVKGAAGELPLGVGKMGKGAIKAVRNAWEGEVIAPPTPYPKSQFPERYIPSTPAAKGRGPRRSTGHTGSAGPHRSAEAALPSEPIDLKRLVLLEEEAQQAEQAAAMAQRGASEQGMRYAAYGKTGAPGGLNRRVSALPRFK